MKKVFIIHGFQGKPNSAWRPWLMSELGKQNIYTCALSMPNPYNPICEEWISEISRCVESNLNDEIYLVGHSLGVMAILRYLESTKEKNIFGAVLVSGPIEKIDKIKDSEINNFFDKKIDFEKIKSKCKSFFIIHGDNDQVVPISNAESLSKELNSELIVIKDGGHLNGMSKCFILPQALEALNKIF